MDIVQTVYQWLYSLWLFACQGGHFLWLSVCQGLHILRSWFFVEECNGATTLLSISFATNTLFTGLSLSRFNFSTWMRHKAVECIDGVADAEFLAKIELIQDNNDIVQKLRKFSDKVKRFTNAIKDVSSVWEVMRRLITIACAAAAAILVAFDTKTRIGLTLVMPYVFFLIWHTCRMWQKILSVKFQYVLLKKAMDKAEKKGLPNSTLSLA